MFTLCGPCTLLQGIGHSPALTVAGTRHQHPFCHFIFQKTTFCYWQPDAPANGFERRQYPIHGYVQDILTSKGYIKQDEVELAREIWGPNVFDIPLPAFSELFKVSIGRGNGRHGVLPLSCLLGSWTFRFDEYRSMLWHPFSSSKSCVFSSGAWMSIGIIVFLPYFS